MTPRTFFLFAFCLSLALTACGRRLQNNQPTLPAPTAVIEASTPITPPKQPATEPLTASAPATPESDPAGDEVESLLQQLDEANTAADQDIQSLSNP